MVRSVSFWGSRLLRTPIRFVIVVAVAGAFAGCEPEIGQPCDPNTADVLDKVKVAAGQNDLVKDVSFETCSAALCASVDGSRPYCTKPCESDLECAEAEGFTCQQIVTFGPLACQDFIDPESEQCVENNCDCVRDGVPSQNPLKYCAAGPDVIAARDAEFGRPPFELPAAEGEGEGE